ncbi:MAG: hypothetical protein K9I85_06450 [Saprospiraceae bacterium]|nr:hypothetical protein [Saprospiraceae bacterium]
MNPILRNVLAVAAGFILGSVVNMGLIMIGGSIVPPPAGVDPSDMESIKASMHLYQPIQFLFPFLAHALGTLSGAYLAARLGASRKQILALIIGVVFLLGGVAAANMLPAPSWFVVTDLLLAYLPMAWVGGKWGS